MSVWLVAVVIGTALAAPQDFNFKKSVVVRSSDHPVETSHIIHAAPPPPTVQVVHKNFDPEAHDRFWNSGSGQALDNAGAQLFAGLGDAASGRRERCVYQDQECVLRSCMVCDNKQGAASVCVCLFVFVLRREGNIMISLP
ncbi:hypothetical protein Pmani_023797 [Petrolisthes manimaculis]|uniref:Uncharacterized protein n=1 Tax=Petrolisthes manimaculis TaxID=1843537 RepID=A0AAE1PBB8_9EUCA|nr:hypothetical protein Pmani_023797 [Petrolisthes manimaculis]